jgi:hypothetical protein
MRTSIPKLHSIKFKNGATADNILYLPHDKDLPPINTLEAAIVANLRGVVLIGYDQNGNEYMACSLDSYKESAYLFARGHMHMLKLGN